MDFYLDILFIQVFSQEIDILLGLYTWYILEKVNYKKFEVGL